MDGRNPSELEPSIRLAFIGDTTLSSVGGAVKAIARDKPEAVVFTGDLANELPGRPAARHIRKWRRSWKDLGPRTYPIPGNHDYGSSGELTDWWSHGASRLGTGAVWFERRAFRLDLAHVTVLGLDCGRSARELDRRQIDWMLAQGREVRAPWRILALHTPICPVSIHINRPMAATSLDRVRELADAVGAHMVVCGHEHLYARVERPVEWIRAQVTVGGGGADPYPVVRSEMAAGVSLAHHLLLEVSASTLSGRAVDRAGACFDSWTWHK